MNLVKDPTGANTSKETHLAARLAAVGASLAASRPIGTDPFSVLPLLLDAPQELIQTTPSLVERIFRSLDVYIAYLDRELNFVRVNQSFAELFGHPQEALAGMNFFADFPNVEIKSLFEKVVTTGQAYSGSADPGPLALKPESGLIYWDWALQPLKNQQEDLVGLLLVMIDVTRQAGAELVLQKRSNLLRLLHEIAVVSNDAVSVEGLLQFAIDRICAFTGWPVGHALLKDSVQGLISTHIWHLDPGVDWTPFKQVSEQADWNRKVGFPGKVIATGAPIWVEDLYASPDFSRPAEARQCGLKSTFAFPTLIASEPVGVLEFFTTQPASVDVELLGMMASMGAQIGRVIERVRFSEALRRSESRFRAIFEESALGIQVNDPRGNLIESNPALQRMLGYSAAELRQVALTEIIHPEDVPHIWQGVQGLVSEEREQFQQVTRYLRKDGSLVWTQQVISLVRDQNGPQFLIFLVNDISESRRMQADLAELQRRLFDSVETERVRLAGELHDGPLQDLYGASFQLQDALPDLQGSGQEDIIANSQAIVQQVISSLRIICGDLRPPTLAPFGLEKAIRAHTARVQKTYPELRIHLELASDGGLLTEQGRMAFFRAYQQLISNAAHHAEAQNVWVRLEIDDHHVILEVEDDGRGFVLPSRWIDLAREGRMGLVSISERAEDFGGHLVVRLGQNGGALIRVAIPRERVLRSE